MTKETNLSHNRKSGKGLPMALLSVILVSTLGAGLFMLFKDTTPPTLGITPDITELGKESMVTVTVEDPGSGLKSLDVVVVQGNKRIPVTTKTYPGGIMRAVEDIPLNDGMIKEGKFTIEATARDASLYPFGASGVASISKDYALDLTPPRIYVQSHTNNLNQGGCGFMVFLCQKKRMKRASRSANDSSRPTAKMAATDRFFIIAYSPTRGTPTSTISNRSSLPRIRRATAPSVLSTTTPTRALSARTKSGSRTLSWNVPFQNFRAWFRTKANTCNQYLYINNQIRKQNRAKLVEFGRQTSPTMLWSGPFKRLPNAANRAQFADSRDYMYKGKKVDFQTHLGLDLASVRHAPVPAGNDGTVVYAEFLGIYGNVVVLDHGLGLQTLYAHLSAIDVAPGDRIARGQIIGKTGATGWRAEIICTMAS